MNKYPSHHILEALTISLNEIDQQFKKVDQLKSLLLAANPIKPQPPSKGSYAAKNRLPMKKHTNSVQNLHVLSKKSLHRNISKQDFEVKEQTQNESQDPEFIIQNKEIEVKHKADKCRNDERQLNELKRVLDFETNEFEQLQKVYLKEIKSIELQTSEIFCRNIVHEIIINLCQSGLDMRTQNLMGNKKSMIERMKFLKNKLSEIEKLKENLEREGREYLKTMEKLNVQDCELEKTLGKISKDAKVLQSSKHELTIKQKQENLKLKETKCIERLKALNQKKTELEAKEQKLDLCLKTAESQKNIQKKEELSIREKKLLSREQKLKDLEEGILIEEQEIEAKRKEVMEKWEKMISKVDDINKQEHKSSYTKQELEDKYKEFNAAKKELERKLSTQESALVNQENIILKKKKKLEDELTELLKREKTVDSC